MRWAWRGRVWGVSKKSSPQARSVRRPRSRGRIDSGVRSVPQARRGRQSGREKETDRVSLKGRITYFLPFTVVPNVIIVSVLLMLAIAGLMFTNTTLVALPATIAQLWLLFNASPLSGDGQVVAAVPILPALILVAVLSNRVFKAVKDKVSLADLNVLVGLALGFPLTLTLISWAMLLDAASVFPVDAPPLLAALGRTLLVHVLVLVIGMGSRLWRALCRRFGLPQWIVDANFTALKFLGSVSVAGLLLSVIMMAAHTSSLGQLFSNFHGVGTAGLVLLSLLYLPNVMVGSSSVLLGGEYHFGDAWVSLFGSHTVPFPTLPWFVVIPQTVYPFAGALLIIPVVLAVWAVRGRLDRTDQPFAEMIVSGLFTGLYTLIACLLITGRMGVYSQTGPMTWLTAVLAVAWLSGVGLLVSGVQNMMGRRAAAMPLPPEPDYPNDPEDLDYPDDEEEADKETTENPAEETEEEVDDSDDLHEIDEDVDEYADEDPESDPESNSEIQEPESTQEFTQRD